MSIVTFIIREEFTMIAADTRITFFEPLNGEKFNDNFSKLSCVGFGWIGGVGYAEFVNTFQSSVQNNQIRTTDDIEPIFNSVYKYLKGKYPEQMIENTKVVYSFAYLDNGFLNMHIESINSVLGHTGIRGKNILVSFLPIDSEEMNLIEGKYKNLIEKSESMEETIFNTACYIEEVSNINITVGKICDFGIMIKKSNDLIVQANIRENVDTIKQAYKNGSLANYIKIITVLSQ